MEWASFGFFTSLDMREMTGDLESLEKLALSHFHASFVVVADEIKG